MPSYAGSWFSPRLMPRAICAYCYCCDTTKTTDIVHMVMVLAEISNPRAIRIHWHHCTMLKTMYCRYDTAMVITPSLFGSESDSRPSDSLRAMLKNDLSYVRPCFLGHFVAQSDMHPCASLLLAHFKSDGVSYPSALLQCKKKTYHRYGHAFSTF